MTRLGRRGALAGGFCLCCAAAARAADAPLVMEEVAAGIFFRRGLDADAAAGNADAICNAGFVIGDDAVCMIDPGGSLSDGAALRQAVRERTARPVTHVVLTHVHPDHVFGAGAFADDHPVFAGHAGLPALLAERGTFYREKLDAALGPGAAGPVVAPTLLVAETSTIDLGGRVLTLAAQPPAHTAADLTVFDARTATLVTGDLLFVRRVPSLDGDLLGWLRVLASLREIPARRVVPGHGPVASDWAAADDLQRYLETLLRETRAAVAAGTPMQDAARTVARGERERWALFDDYNERNVLEAYRMLEWE